MFSKNAPTTRCTRFLSALTTLGILTSGLFAPSPASAADEGGLVYEQNGWQVLYESSEKVPVSDVSGTLTLKGGTTYTVSRDTSASKDCRINFESGSVGDVTVRLNGVDCSENSLSSAPGFDARRGGYNTTIYLMPNTNNSFRGGGDSAGIAKDDGGGVLMIDAENESGGLTATGGTYSAGIGGAWGASVSGITISGGTVKATGGEYAAGVGGGVGSGGAYSVSGITISGGTVKASGLLKYHTKIF